jgi:hypothetical protein
MIVLVNSLTHHPRNAEIYNLDDIDDLVASIEGVGRKTIIQKILIWIGKSELTVVMCRCRSHQSSSSQTVV